MKRLFWMGVGGAVAITVARRARQQLEPVMAVTGPVTGWLAEIRKARAELRSAMHEHEADLRRTFVEDIATPERPAPDPRRQGPPSWAGRVDDEDGDDLYSF